MSTAHEPIDRLPHREPFRFVTGLVSHTPGESGTGVWSVNGTEDFFRGHFPGSPVVPGVLLGEALAQISGLVGCDERRPAARLAHIDLRFHAPVVPPADVVLRTQLVRSMGTLSTFEVEALVGDSRVASGSLTLAVSPQ